MSKRKPDPVREATRALVREVLSDVIALEPCHITGMHDPTHTPRYVCRDQKAEAFDRLLAYLGLTEERLPRRRHPDCYWCHGEDGEERHHQLALWEERGTKAAVKLLALAFLRDMRTRDVRGQPRYWSLKLLAANLHLKAVTARLRRAMVELQRQRLVTDKLVSQGDGKVTGWRATSSKRRPR